MKVSTLLRELPHLQFRIPEGDKSATMWHLWEYLQQRDWSDKLYILSLVNPDRWVKVDASITHLLEEVKSIDKLSAKLTLEDRGTQPLGSVKDTLMGMVWKILEDEPNPFPPPKVESPDMDVLVFCKRYNVCGISEAMLFAINQTGKSLMSSTWEYLKEHREFEAVVSIVDAMKHLTPPQAMDISDRVHSKIEVFPGFTVKGIRDVCALPNKQVLLEDAPAVYHDECDGPWGSPNSAWYDGLFMSYPPSAEELKYSEPGEQWFFNSDLYSADDDIKDLNNLVPYGRALHNLDRDLSRLIEGLRDDTPLIRYDVLLATEYVVVALRLARYAYWAQKGRLILSPESSLRDGMEDLAEEAVKDFPNPFKKVQQAVNE